MPDLSVLEMPDAYHRDGPALSSTSDMPIVEPAPPPEPEPPKAKPSSPAKTWEDSARQAADTHADFLAVAGDKDLQISDPMAHAIVRVEQGPEIAYWLGKNPNEAARIAKLEPMAAIVEIGKLSHRAATGGLAAAPPRAAAARQPSAPNPPRALDELSMDEYAARRRAERAAVHRAKTPDPVPIRLGVAMAAAFSRPPSAREQ